MLSKVVPVSEIMLRAREAADMVRTNFVTDEELVRYISNEYTDLYDLLTMKYQLYYASPTPFVIQQTGVDMYALPTNLYKVTGVERMDSSASSGQYTTMYPFNFTERNIVSSFNVLSQKYCIVGDQIMFKGGNLRAQVRIWYIPAPADLAQIFRLDSVDFTTSTFTAADSNLAQGDYVYFKGPHLPTGIVAGQKYWIVNPTANTFQVSLAEDDTPATFTDNGSGIIKVDWYGAGQPIDGVSGWEELIVLGAAIRMMQKEESDTRPLDARRQVLYKRIEAAAQARDVGNAPTVTDVRTLTQELEYPFLFRGA